MLEFDGDPPNQWLISTQVQALGPESVGDADRGKLGDGRPASVKIFRPLPHTNLPPRVVGAVVENVDGGVEKMMVESMFADASQ